VTIGDLLSFYATVERIGNTSISVRVEVYAERNPADMQIVKVTEASLTYVAIDPGRGAVACANAGHPAPRLILPDGTVSGLDASGVVLGIDSGQEYREVHADLPVGTTIVLYTDGVIEARRDGELYGTERLDALLVRRRQLPARELAHAVTEDARRYSGGELSDDLAVVVIRRVS